MLAGKILSWDFNPWRYVCKYRCRNESWQEDKKSLSSKRGAGTRDEAPLTILCPLLKKLDYCTFWAYLFSVSINYQFLKCPQTKNVCFLIKSTHFYEPPRKNHMFCNLNSMCFFEMWTFKVATILAHYKLVCFRKPLGNKVAVTSIKKTMSQFKEHLFYNFRHK